MNLSLRHSIVLLAFAISAGSASAATPPATPSPPASTPTPVGSWPRQVILSNAVALIYQPQVNNWTDNRLDFRSAVAIKRKGADDAFGVIFASTRTNVDKASHRVTLDNMQITKSDFPTLPDHGAAYAAELQKVFAKGVRTISLDRLKHSPALPGTAAPAAAVQNNVPRIIFSQSPAILVPIEGAPVVRPIANNTVFQRVINTRALILQRVVEKDYFIRVFDGWLVSASIQGPWKQAFIAPPGIDAVGKAINATHAVDMLDAGPGASPRPTLAKGVPTIYISTGPAELLVFDGPPDFAPIVGTSLTWATNTTSDVLVDTTSNDYFVLLAGRWFRSSALNGQWSFVASNALPQDFARIPAGSLAGAVLQAVAGTPQAKQALNENSIAQTAKVPLKNGPKFTPKFDGAPQFATIPGTTLSYVTNASAPVVRAAPDAFYAVRAGVWFTAPQATGPWTVATKVPDAIYTIPASSPIFYITYVRIYDVTATTVNMGYTPGYLGTAVSPSGTVVFGTGYTYSSWIGNDWYPAPATYGVAASPIYNKDTGYTYAFAIGLGTPSWTGPYSQTVFYHPGYFGSYPCCATASANVYRRYNANANLNSANIGAGGVSGGKWTGSSPGQNPGGGGGGGGGGTYSNAQRYDAPPANNARTAQWQPYSLPKLQNVYVDASGNVYRQGDSGWQQNTGGTWGSASGDTTWADQESQARDNSDVAAASYSMSNTTRFTNDPNSGWNAQDRGDGGYSRTLGGSGGISSEYYNYWNTVQDNAIDMWWNGGVMTYYGGIGWTTQFP